jgi:hypothetical protein
MALVKMVHAMGLKVQAVMSFHACGGNVGDSCLVSLPYWVLQEAEKNPEVLYTDQNGNRNGEYLSLGVDCLPLFEGRSPVQIYHDFMESFRDTFKEFLGDCIVVGVLPLLECCAVRLVSSCSAYNESGLKGKGEALPLLVRSAWIPCKRQGLDVVTGIAELIFLLILSQTVCDGFITKRRGPNLKHATR